MVLAGVLAGQQLFSVPPRSSIHIALHEALHVPWFFVVTLCLTAVLNSKLWIAVAMVGFAVGTELLQPAFGRTFAVDDAIANLFGGALGILFVFARRRQIRWLSWSAATIVVLALAVPPGRLVVAQRIRDRALPIVFEPGRWWNLPFTYSNCRRKTVDDGPNDMGPALELELCPRKYPRVVLRELSQDWTPYRWLDVDVFFDVGEDSDPVKLTVAVRRNHSKRTVARVTLDLVPGRNRLRFPLAPLSIDERGRGATINRVVVHTNGGRPGSTVFLGIMALVR